MPCTPEYTGVWRVAHVAHNSPVTKRSLALTDLRLVFFEDGATGRLAAIEIKI